MCLEKEIEELREQLNNITLNLEKEKLCKDEIVKLSKKLDNLIIKYYLKDD